MAILIYVDASLGKINKAGFEAVGYGRSIADKTGSQAHVILVGDASNANELGNYGANKVHQVKGANSADTQSVTKIIVAAANAVGAKTLVFSFDDQGKAVAPRVSARLNAGLVTNVMELPADNGNVKRAVFSGKAFANFEIKTETKIYAIAPNAIGVKTFGGSAEMVDFAIPADAQNTTVTVKETKRNEGTISLPEADLVVSAGRGMKGPENWGMIEQLATELGAATACSRPVADMHWRPHHEHVGQTGVAVAPNLYIAIGISGAIQHLAGVNRSKVMVVINNDPEAPFFKAADYGIVGDAFTIVPKLIEAVKKHKASLN